MKKTNTLSPLLLLSAAAIWGFAFVAQDKASNIGAFTLGALRSILAGIFLFFLTFATDKFLKTGRKLISKKGLDFSRYEIFSGLVLGVILTVATALQQLGINSGTDGGKAGFITALYVVLVPVYALVLKKKAPINVWVSVGIAVVGFYLLCIKDGFTIAPSDALVLCSSLIFPIHILTIDKFSPKCDGVRMSCIQFFTCAILNGIIAIFAERGGDISLVLENIPSILYLGIMSSGVAYTLQIIGQRGVHPATASIILSLESVFGVIGTAVLLQQRMTVKEYIGCAIVLFAVILSQLDFKKKDTSKE